MGVPWIWESFHSCDVLIVWVWVEGAGGQNVGTIWTGSGLALCWEYRPAPLLFPPSGAVLTRFPGFSLRD